LADLVRLLPEDDSDSVLQAIRVLGRRAGAAISAIRRRRTGTVS
jgi:hypothetical protein